jgi:hypothetical protein
MTSVGKKSMTTGQIRFYKFPNDNDDFVRINQLG